MTMSAGNRTNVQESLFVPYVAYSPLAPIEFEGGGEQMLGGSGPTDSVTTEPYPGPEGGPASQESTDDQTPPSEVYPAPNEGSGGNGITFWQGVLNFFTKLLSWITPGAFAHDSTEENTTIAAPLLLPLAEGGTYTVSIDYTYDPLYRLTGADFSTGEVYTYTYDIVGNRTEQTNPIGTTSYQYDAANRLTNVGGTSYTWDDNGNLLDDGDNTYTYDYENRLSSVTNEENSFEFAYNGLGHRYQQVVNGETITYTLDLASPLPQVLVDNRHDYLYGLGLIAQQSGDVAEYVLPDALGSVRQVANGYGNVVMAKSFDPFGNPISMDGVPLTAYGFTGEWNDATGLQYLRARYYSPTQGRFLTKDPFVGYLGVPATLNPYTYSLNNPVLYSDPSGENPLLIAAILGGLFSSVINLGFQLYHIQPHNMYEALHCVNWGEVAIAFGAGAVAGLVYFSVFTATTALLGTGFWASITAGSLSGVLAGHFSRLTGSVLSGQNNQGSVTSFGNIVFDAILGGIGGMVSYGLQRGLSGIAEDIMQTLTNSANRRLAANPALTESVLSKLEYIAGKTNPGVAKMQYGNAVEELMARQVEGSWFLKPLFRHIGGPYNPDFIGKGPFSGINFDVTTNTARSITQHLTRSYGTGLIITTYSRPPSFWLFP